MQRYQYLITPRSDMQAILPNWYNIAYRRSGAYKGMGLIRYPGTGIGQASDYPPDDLSGAVAELDKLEVGRWGPTGGGTFASMLDTVASTYGTPFQAAGVSSGSSIPTWVPWAVGGALLLLVMSRGRR